MISNSSSPAPLAEEYRSVFCDLNSRSQSSLSEGSKHYLSIPETAKFEPEVTKDSAGRFCCQRSNCKADVKYFDNIQDWREVCKTTETVANLFLGSI
jgi:hypothetical protein